MPLSTLLEHALRWGAPVCPLVVMMLLFLIFTPSSMPAEESAAFYLMGMAGAMAGFLGCSAVRTWTSRRYQAACWGAAAALELAWVALLWGYNAAGSVLTTAGSVLTGASTAVLLALWLHIDQTTNLRCELAKIGTALVFAFLVHALFGVAPGATNIGFAFPLVTGLPLALELRRASAAEDAALSVPAPQARAACAEPDDADDASGAPVPLLAHLTARELTALAPSSVLLAALGAGMCALGFGGQVSEYGLGLAGIALVAFALSPRITRPLSLAGLLATPVVVLALLYAAGMDSGSPFSIYLAGFGLFVVWALLAQRRREHGIRLASMRRTALTCLWITACIAVGLACSFACTQALGVADTQLAMALAAAAVIADFAWRMVALPIYQQMPVGELDASDRPQDTTTPDTEVLATTFGLSPREAQVAALLLENRSLSYVCTTLGLATSTAKTHVRHVYEKLGVHSKSELQLHVEERLGTRP